MCKVGHPNTVLCYKYSKIQQTTKNVRYTSFLLHAVLSRQVIGGILNSFPVAPKNFHMPSSWLWEIFEGDFADMCVGKFLLVSMEGRDCAKRVQKFLIFLLIILDASIYLFNSSKNKSLTEI